MSIEENAAAISALRDSLGLIDARLQKLEALLDEENHDLFEQWFKDFLDDKCFGGW